MDTDSTADAVAQAPERVERTSTNPLDDQVEKLKTLFPECVSEGRVDFEQLRAVLGGDLAGDDAYRLTWAGKKDAFQQVQSPSRGTLAVDDDESLYFDHTDHIFIEGENLEVLKTLYKSYYGRVKMTYRPKFSSSAKANLTAWDSPEEGVMDELDDDAVNLWLYFDE